MRAHLQRWRRKRDAELGYTPVIDWAIPLQLLALYAFLTTVTILSWGHIENFFHWYAGLFG